jgi:hypothetical protein
MPLATPKKTKAVASASKPAAKSAAKSVAKSVAKMSDYDVDDLTSDFSAQIIQAYVDDGMSTLQYGGHVHFGTGISVPYLIGGWDEQIRDPNDEWSHITKKYTIIRLIPTAGFSLQSLELKWVDAQTLKLVIPWPSWFTKISNHVGFQEGEDKARIFDVDHKAMNSMQNNKAAKVENPNVENKLKRIVDDGCFQFERPMKTGKKDIETAMIKIPITAKDIDTAKGEELPEGGQVRVLQMILTEETPKKEDESESPIRFNDKERVGKLGKEPGGIRSEHLHLMKSRNDRRSVDASVNASMNASASNTITTTTTGPTTFWNAEAGVGTSSLALAAFKHKNDPPVQHKPVDIDVDNEVHGEDDYMPPPDESGNKRPRMLSNSKSTVVPPDE